MIDFPGNVTDKPDPVPLLGRAKVHIDRADALRAALVSIAEEGPAGALGTVDGLFKRELAEAQRLIALAS